VGDTSPEAAAQLDALMAQRSGSDRVRMACEMFDLARALAVAAIRAEEPTISDADLRVRLFERLYGGDFSEEKRARIPRFAMTNGTTPANVLMPSCHLQATEPP